MTADNADGGTVPPTTHYAIKPCCLICEEFFLCEKGECTGANGICGDFTLRDFGYPVRKVEVE